MSKFNLLLSPLLFFLLVACSLPPERPVTREELMRSRVYSQYIIEESPEEVLNALNREGDVVLNAKRNVPGKNYPVHVKILATSEGLEVLDYDK